jgi:hypothetical protein
MAVITLDAEKNTVTILVEKSDLIHERRGNMLEVGIGNKHTIGKVFANGEVKLCMVRGER